MQKLAILIIVLLTLIGCPREIKQELKEPPNLSIVQSYSSICDISSITTTKGKERRMTRGSGILISGKFILTASHVVDFNDNAKIDDNEKLINFDLGERDIWYKAEVIAITDHNSDNTPDLALLKILSKIDSDATPARISEHEVTIGDQINYIGRRRDKPATICPGIVGPKMDDHIVSTSASTWFGASGGGVFNSNNELVGVIKSVGAANRSISVVTSMPYENGIIFVRGHGTYQAIMPNDAYYTSLISVREFLANHDALPDPPKRVEVPKKNSKLKRWWHLRWLFVDFLAMGIFGLIVYRVRRRSR